MLNYQRVVPFKKKGGKHSPSVSELPIKLPTGGFLSCILDYLGIGIEIFWPNLKSGIRMTRRKQRNVGFES